MQQRTYKKIPIARCANPSCGCTILYGSDPKDKRNVRVRMAPPDYRGLTYLCPRCKTMLWIDDRRASGVVAVPLVESISKRKSKVSHPLGSEIERQG